MVLIIYFAPNYKNADGNEWSEMRNLTTKSVFQKKSCYLALAVAALNIYTFGLPTRTSIKTRCRYQRCRPLAAVWGAFLGATRLDATSWVNDPRTYGISARYNF